MIILKIAIAVIAVVLILALALFGIMVAGLINFKKAGKGNRQEITNPHITKDGETLVAAHRSGAGIAPENTLMAFQHCLSNKDFFVDVYEFDLALTKDNHLILLHDDTLDRTTNACEHFGGKDIEPKTKTLTELRELNFGESFCDKNGNYPYRGLRGNNIPDNLRAVTVEEVFDLLESVKEYRYIIELKDPEEQGFKACDELYRILKERNMLERVSVGTFNNEVAKYATKHHPDLIRSGSPFEIFLYYLCVITNYKIKPTTFGFTVLHIPNEKYPGVRLGTKRLVEYSHRNNIAVQFWTINDTWEMDYLHQLNADAVMTDTPDVAYKIFNSRN